MRGGHAQAATTGGLTTCDALLPVTATVLLRPDGRHASSNPAAAAEAGGVVRPGQLGPAQTTP